MPENADVDKRLMLISGVGSISHHKISQHSWNSLKTHPHLGEMPILCKNAGDPHLCHDHH
jgi:hypothetical protein